MGKFSNQLRSIIWISSFTVLQGCISGETIPPSLEEIMERNEANSTGSGNSGGGGGAVRYKGASETVVRQLLSRVSGWKTPSCTSCNDGMPPDVKINNNCIRDTYVAAAVAYAWAIESYYRLGETARAAALVPQMNENLQNARNLCGNSTVNLGSCITMYIYGC